MSLKSFSKNFISILLTVGVIFSCCSCDVKKSDKDPTPSETVSSMVEDIRFDSDHNVEMLLDNVCAITKYEPDYSSLICYNDFLKVTFSGTVVTRAQWLKLLLEKLNIEKSEYDPSNYALVSDRNYYSDSEYFITAIENGILYRGWTEFDNNAPITKQFVSTSFSRAMEYNINCVLYCNDYYDIDEKIEAATMVYLGYFELDENYCFNPEEVIEKEKADYLLSEIDVYKALENKTVLSFGDSIMHGEGNDYVGIAELISLKYNTNAIDYSKGGATFGVATGREQISNQILRAIQNNEQADVILINGGTNDMRHVPFGAVADKDDFAYGEHGRNQFCQGMEYALGLLKDNYPDTPLLYIRAHDMMFSLERNELHYGKTALDICKKWDVPVADIFNDTDFDAHDEDIRYEYTYHSRRCPYGDSVHPNRDGYYKYYVPLVVTELLELTTND